MVPSFLPGFWRGSSPLQDDAVRAKLAQAIFDKDPIAFRAILQGAYPDLAAEHRLYGILMMTAGGMRPLMVDERGQPIRDPGYMIAASTPMDLLNVQYGESEMTVTVGDDVWKTPYEPAEPGAARNRPRE
jgi:hypothetical protein